MCVYVCVCTFPVNIQHARNTNMVVQCEKCGMWRIFYSKYKLKELESGLGINYVYTYTCGSSTVCIRTI